MRNFALLLFVFTLTGCISVSEKNYIANTDSSRDGYPCIRTEGQEVKYVQCNQEYLVSRYRSRIEYLETNNNNASSRPDDLLTKSREALNFGKYKKAAGYAVKVLQMESTGPLYSEAVDLLYEALVRDKKYEDAYAIQKQYKR
jgi:uncharacterized lipoprotein